MPKKNMTEEEKKAWGEKMRQARAAKKTIEVEQASGPVAGEAPVTEHPAPQETVTIGANEFNNMLRLVEEMLKNGGVPQSGARVSGNRLVGTTEKYVVDPTHYPDPTERLSNEPQLQRFAFKDNYELNYEVTTTAYETRDGLNMVEPKFRLALIRKLYDDDTGELTNRRYTVCQLIFHEDPQAALVVAREHGLDVPEEMEESFLEEMRYLRMRDWLVEAFYPPKSQQKNNKREMVIGGRLVEVFEINSEDSERIPFDQVANKRFRA